MRIKILSLLVVVFLSTYAKGIYNIESYELGDYVSHDGTLYHSVKITIENQDSVNLLVSYRTTRFGGSYSNCPVEHFLDDIGYGLVENNDTLQCVPSYIFTDINPSENFVFYIAYPHTISLKEIENSIRVNTSSSIDMHHPVFEKLKYKGKEIIFSL